MTSHPMHRAVRSCRVGAGRVVVSTCRRVDVSFAQIVAPHCWQPRVSCAAGSVKLIVCDTTEIDYGGQRVPVLQTVADRRHARAKLFLAAGASC